MLLSLYVDTEQEDKLERESFIDELSDIFLFFLTRVEEHHQKLLGNISTARIYVSIFSLSHTSFPPYMPVYYI